MSFSIRAVRRPLLLAAVPLLAAVAVAPFWAPLVSRVEAATSTLLAPSITTGVGYAINVPIMLDSAPNGISGFEMTISLSDPNVASIDGVVIPSEFGLTFFEQVSPSEIRVMGLDFNQALQGNLSDVTLATVSMTTTRQGTSAIQISLTRLDDDAGLTVNPQTSDGSLNVKKHFKDGSRDGGNGGGNAGNKGGGKGGGPKK